MRKRPDASECPALGPRRCESDRRERPLSGLPIVKPCTKKLPSGKDHWSAFPSADDSRSDDLGLSHILDLKVIGAVVVGRKVLHSLAQCAVTSEPFARFEQVQRHTNANHEQVKGSKQRFDLVGPRWLFDNVLDHQIEALRSECGD